MNYSTEEIINKLINNIATMCEVQSVGISGSKNPFPQADEGDIDIFIYCDRIPVLTQREAIISQMGDLLQEGQTAVFAGGHWGAGDFGLVNGVETWLMYFTVNETTEEIDAILHGDYPDKLDNYYYPIGRCAMLKDINILFDRNGILAGLKTRLLKYPEELVKTLLAYHLDELADREDLERAVTRKDVLFYHFALDLAIDHFLQALFAINRTYFPSRKRSLEYIESFRIQPEKCSARLLEVLKFGGDPAGISQSYALWNDLVNELKRVRL